MFNIFAVQNKNIQEYKNTRKSVSIIKHMRCDVCLLTCVYVCVHVCVCVCVYRLRHTAS